MWTEIFNRSNVQLELEYATSDNFTGHKIYPCPRCFLRPKIARKINKISKALKEIDLGLILYDCYRPESAQKQLWKAYPDKRFVAPPEKGSMHSRGVAIDLTISDSDGIAIDMGTPYDYFGKEAAPSFDIQEENIRSNRKLLQDIMVKHQFTQARSEWWHFSFTGQSYPLDSWAWECYF